MNKVYTKEEIREMVTTNDAWAIRAILALYKRQTDSEKVEGSTNVHNGRGFNKFDAEFMTSLVAFYNKAGFLTEGQLKSAKRKLGKYSRQLLEIAQEKSNG